MELILLTDYRGALRQKQQTWESLDTGRVAAGLRSAGITVRELRYEQVVNEPVILSGATIHYTSTQDPGYRGFVDDVLYALSLDNRLVPHYPIFRCHEDKGFQELWKRRLGIPSLDWRYLATDRGTRRYVEDMSFPAVFKSAGGYQSRGVRLARDRDDLSRTVRRFNRPRGLAVYRLKRLIKRHVLKRRYHPEMYEECVHTGGWVLQEFVPDVPGDWKILVFADRLFALRRLSRPGDFRASGSGRFSFDEPPARVLDLASEVCARLDVPMLSADIIDGPAGCRLVEFQGVHFGTYTLDLAPHHYRRDGGGWTRVEGASVLEDEYARSLARYLRAGDAARSAGGGPGRERR
ncbi:MAG: hypothetical protein R6X25_02870 [Candidatus Krumholzibacteriia bacterium]